MQKLQSPYSIHIINCTTHCNFAKVGYYRYSLLMSLNNYLLVSERLDSSFLKLIGTKTVTLEWKIKKPCQISYLSRCTSTWHISAILRIALACCDRKSKAFWQNHRPYLNLFYPNYLGFKLLQSLHSCLSYVYEPSCMAHQLHFALIWVIATSFSDVRLVLQALFNLM